MIIIKHKFIVISFEHVDIYARFINLATTVKSENFPNKKKNNQMEQKNKKWANRRAVTCETYMWVYNVSVFFASSKLFGHFLFDFLIIFPRMWGAGHMTKIKFFYTLSIITGSPLKFYCNGSELTASDSCIRPHYLPISPDSLVVSCTHSAYTGYVKDHVSRARNIRTTAHLSGPMWSEALPLHEYNFSTFQPPLPSPRSTVILITIIFTPYIYNLGFADVMRFSRPPMDCS